jgi:class 3 adenylate cyclase/tetratricopeptide (TPR) repeat protein
MQKSMFFWIWSVALMVLCQPIRSQDGAIDSLKTIVEQNIRDSSMVLTINELSVQLIQEDDLTQAKEYASKAIDLAAEIGFPKGKAYALKNLGIAEYYQGNYKEVFDYWTQSLQVFESIQDTLGIANIANNLGAVYYDQGSHDKALEYYFKSLAISEKLNEPVRISSALVNIGGVYSQMMDYEKALDYYQQVEKFLPTLNDPQIQSTYLMGIGEVYSLEGHPERAISYYQEALKINMETQDYAHNLTMIGKEEFTRGNIEKAINYLDLAYATASKSNLPLDQVQTLLALGNVYQKNNFSKALKAYDEAETIALEMETTEELRDIYEGKSIAYMEARRFKEAYENQAKYIQLKDQIFNTKTDDKIRGLQYDFDIQKRDDQIVLLEKEAELTEEKGKRQKSAIYISILAAFLILLSALGIYGRYKYVKRSNKLINEEKDRSDALLLNILPDATAKELKLNGKVEAKKFDSVTVLFADFKGFTEYSSDLSPEELVKSVDYFFSKFDKIMEKYGLEKIKTIGDAYMCAGGLPFPTKDHSHKMMQAAFEIIEVMKKAENQRDEGVMPFEVRVGLNTGPVVAGVVGLKKFAYDIWGDTVNVAARMESMSEPGRINVSEATYQLIRNDFNCEKRGEVFVKNKGMMHMYFVNGVKKKTASKKIKEVV